MAFSLSGLTAAVYTPLHADGSLGLEQVPCMVDHLDRSGADGIYVCGSTGEGMSLTGDERRAVAEAFLAAARGRLRTVVQVGHNSLAEARDLAAHAADQGAEAISATCPSYYPIASPEVLAACMAEVAAGAPETPFYYYHIPSLTGIALDAAAFLERAAEAIPTLAGLKYTCPTVFEFQRCLAAGGGRFDCLWGCDEMLLSALVVGAAGAIGSTYNVAAPLYRRLLAAFDRGDLAEARRLQGLSVALVGVLQRYPFHAATKQVLTWLGVEAGPCRLPLANLAGTQAAALRRDLDALDFFTWARP